MDTNLKIIAIDQEIYEMIKDYKAFIYAIHNNSLHLSVSNTLVTLGDKIPEGKHHIVTDKNIIFSELNIRKYQKAYIEENFLYVGDLKLDIDNLSIKDYQSYDLTYKMRDDIDLIIIQLLDIIDKHIESQMFVKYNPSIMKIVLNRVNQFLDKPNLIHAKLILGLGQGLTPYGDDILVGYIMGCNTIGQSIDWIEELVELANEKTTKLSAQNIKDTHKRIYSNIYADMIEELFKKNKTEHAMKMMNIGDTSGVGMLLGFLHGIKKERGI
ncbi:MAG: DUF2877 domain-containing protein [Acholeplasmataceae bacterium]|nr:DUF2877 domain-containing protein [Acholeplasmataceae bacterium]